MHPGRLFASFYHGFSGLSRGFDKKSGKREIFSAGWCKNGNRVTQNGCFFRLRFRTGFCTGEHREARITAKPASAGKAGRGFRQNAVAGRQSGGAPPRRFLSERGGGQAPSGFFRGFHRNRGATALAHGNGRRRPHVFSMAECAGGGGRQAHPDKAVLLLRKPAEKCCFRRVFLKP